MRIEPRSIETGEDRVEHTKPFVPEDVTPQTIEALESRELKQYLNKLDNVYFWHDDWLTRRFSAPESQYEEEFSVILMHGFDVVRNNIISDVLENEEVEADSDRAQNLARSNRALQEAISNFSRVHGDLIDSLRNYEDSFEYKQAKKEIVQAVYEMLIKLEKLTEDAYGEPKKPLAKEIMTAGTAVRSEELVGEGTDPIEYWFVDDEKEGKKRTSGAASWEVESQSYEREHGGITHKERFRTEEEFTDSELERMRTHLDNELVVWSNSKGSSLGKMADLLAFEKAYPFHLRNQSKLERLRSSVRDHLIKEVQDGIRNDQLMRAVKSAEKLLLIFDETDWASHEELGPYLAKIRERILQSDLSDDIRVQDFAEEVVFLNHYDPETVRKLDKAHPDARELTMRVLSETLEEAREGDTRSPTKVMAQTGYYLQEMSS